MLSCTGGGLWKVPGRGEAMNLRRHQRQHQRLLLLLLLHHYLCHCAHQPWRPVVDNRDEVSRGQWARFET